MTLRFQEIFLTEPYFLLGGPLETRIQCSTDLLLDKHRSLFKLLYQQKGINALAHLYRQDTQIAQQHNIPIILHAPTLRASARYIQQAGYKLPDAIQKINHDAVNVTQAIRHQFASFTEGVFIAGTLGPQWADPLDAGYADCTIDSAYAYHLPQVQALATTPIDIIHVSMMTHKNEIIGAARAATQADRTYGVGMIINENGCLADGTPVVEVIETIDAALSPRPFFYSIDCTYTDAIAKLFDKSKTIYQRILAVRVNGANKTPAQFAKMKRTLPVPVTPFASAVVALAQRNPIKLWGGCCGTDHRHLNALCEALKATFL